MVEAEQLSKISTKSIAIISGKGGSGKTMVATAFAQGLASQAKKVLLVDADFGTGGLTYYLGFSAFDRARDGLADFLSAKEKILPAITSARRDAVSEDETLGNVSLLPVGEHRLIDGQLSIIEKSAIGKLIQLIEDKFDIIIFDCRGGIDGDSLAVCGAVDEVLMVVETDAASIQASQRLANVLYESGLGRRLRGFVLNKVMDNPIALGNVGKSLFRCENLGAIPFDIESTRRFVKGFPPAPTSLFCRHVFRIIPDVVHGVDALYKTQILSPEEFDSITTKSPEIQLGGMVLLLTMMPYLAVAYYALGGMRYFSYADAVLVGGLIMLFLAGLSDTLKQSLGAMVRTYLRINTRMYRKIARKF